MPTRIKPNSRPQVKREVIERLLKKHGVTEPVCVVGVRGYYRDTMGKKGQNDRGIFDDGMILISNDFY
jgi:hypothetical protein